MLLATCSLPFVSEFRAYRSAIDTTRVTADAALEAADRTNRSNVEIARIQADAHVTATRVAAGLDERPAVVRAIELPLPVAITIDTAAAGLARLAYMDPSRLVSFAASDYVPFRPALLELAPYAGTIQWNEGPPRPPQRRTAPKPRSSAVSPRRMASAGSLTLLG